MHRSQIFQLLLGGFLGGVIAASFLVLPAWLVWAMLGLGLAGLAMPRQVFMVAGCLVLGLLGGILRTQAVLDRPFPLTAAALGGAQVIIDGFVDGDVASTKTGVQYPFRVLRITVDSQMQDIDDRVVIFGSDSLRPRYGQVLSLSGKLQHPKSAGTFDYAAYLAKDGTHALMYFPEYSVPVDWRPSASIRAKLAVFGRLHAIRDNLALAIAHSVRAPESSYLTGILVGAQGVVGADIKDMFAKTGTSHILAISGYNITVVAAALMALLSRLGRRRSFWFTVIGITAFAIMTGASASVVRAAIMGILALVARQLGRQSSSLNAILLSAAAMSLYNPLLLRWDIGFQFSFLALVGIVYLEPLLTPGLMRLMRSESLARAAGTTIAASVMVLPLSLSYFGQLPIYTLPANLLVLPLVPLAMALGLATGIAALIWPLLGQVIGQIAWLLAAFQLGVVRFFAGLPYAALQVNVSVPMLISIYAALATGLILQYRKTPISTTTQATL